MYGFHTPIVGALTCMVMFIAIVEVYRWCRRTVLVVHVFICSQHCKPHWQRRADQWNFICNEILLGKQAFSPLFGTYSRLCTLHITKRSSILDTYALHASSYSPFSSRASTGFKAVYGVERRAENPENDFETLCAEFASAQNQRTRILPVCALREGVCFK